MFDYFYGNEAEQFQYYRIPALLFTDDVFKKLSTDAKVLYGLLLDRAGLSAKNGWKDADGKIYVYYTLEEATEYLNCARDKAIKSFAELDAAKGIGLIERKRQGLGRPTKIYVKSFYRPSSEQETVDRPPEVDKTDFKRSEISTSRSRKNRPLEVEKNDPNQTDIIHPEFSQLESIHPSSTVPPEANGWMDGFSAATVESIEEPQLPTSVETVLPEIGYTTGITLPEIQEIGLDSEMLRHCQIPYTFSRNKRTMEAAIRAITAFDYYVQEDDNPLDRMIIAALAAMASKETAMYNGQSVTYAQVIDKLNELLSQRGCIIDWVEDFRHEWKKIMQERHGEIKNQVAYLKSCLWTYLNVSDFEEANLLLSIPKNS